MSCEEQYTLYKEFPIWCEMIVGCSKDPPCENTPAHEELLRNESFRRLDIQVLAPAKMSFADLRDDCRTYAFIDEYWSSLVVSSPSAVCGKIAGFNYVSDESYQDNDPDENAMATIYFSPSDVVDTWRIMNEVERESIYDKSKPLLILPNIAYMIPPH